MRRVHSLVAVALLVAGCGSATRQTGPGNVATRMIHAVDSGDGVTACGLLTAGQRTVTPCGSVALRIYRAYRHGTVSGVTTRGAEADIAVDTPGGAHVMLLRREHARWLVAAPGS